MTHARLRASIDVDAPAFPFPHRIEVTATVRDPELRVETTFVPDGAAAGAGVVRLASLPPAPGCAAQQVAAAAPAAPSPRRSTTAASRPASRPRGPGDDPIGRRTFDDGYALRPRPSAAHRRTTPAQPIELRCGAGYPFAQVWVPRRQAVRRARAHDRADQRARRWQGTVVRRGDSFTATFTLTLDRIR